MTRTILFLICSRFSSSGCETLVTVALRSAASSTILRVYASASVARSIAFLKRAVAISSIVRVILRMLRIALRRLTIARVFATRVYPTGPECQRGVLLPPAGARGR